MPPRRLFTAIAAEATLAPPEPSAYHPSQSPASSSACGMFQRMFTPSFAQRSRRLGLALAVGSSLAGGCDIRDEPVQPAASSAARLLRADAPELAGLLRGSDIGPAAPRASIEYVEGFEAGLRRAATENKPLLMICRAAWCRWSAEMAQGPLADRRIVELSRQFVCVMVDADRNADTCRALGVTAFPTVVILSPAGEEQSRTVGRPSAATLTAALESGLRPTMAAGSTPPRR